MGKNFKLKLQTVVEITAKNYKGLIFAALPST